MAGIGRGHAFSDPDALYEMLRLYMEGWSFPALGHYFMCDHTSIIYQVKKHGCWHHPQRKILPKVLRVRVFEGELLVPETVAVPKPVTIQQVFKPIPIIRKARERRVPKYAAILEEGYGKGKMYREYIREEQRRHPEVKSYQEEMLERLRAEKKERDEKIERGEIYVDPKQEYSPYFT